MSVGGGGAPDLPPPLLDLGVTTESLQLSTPLGRPLFVLDGYCLFKPLWIEKSISILLISNMFIPILVPKIQSSLPFNEKIFLEKNRFMFALCTQQKHLTKIDIIM